MTTATDVDVEAWLRGDIEVPCEMRFFGERACDDPATWMMYGRKECACDSRTTAFMCDEHKDLALVLGVLCAMCATKGEITHMERIKK